MLKLWERLFANYNQGRKWGAGIMTLREFLKLIDEKNLYFEVIGIQIKDYETFNVKLESKKK